jgi:hypothetical protein
MIDDCLVILHNNDLHLYRPDSHEVIASEVHRFGIIGRRALFQGRFGDVKYREDIITSQWKEVQIKPGLLLGVAFNNFIGLSRGNIVASLDGFEWRRLRIIVRGHSRIIDGAVIHGDGPVSYTTDGIRWIDLPCGNVVAIRKDTAYAIDLDSLQCFRNGILIAKYPWDIWISFALWRGCPLVQTMQGCYLYSQDKKIRVNIRGSVCSDGYMLSCDGQITTDFKNFRKVDGRIVAVNDKLIALRDNGFEILHEPSSFEKAFYYLPRSRNLMATMRRFGVPFVLILLTAELIQ